MYTDKPTVPTREQIRTDFVTYMCGQVITDPAVQEQITERVLEVAPLDTDWRIDEDGHYSNPRLGIGGSGFEQIAYRIAAGDATADGRWHRFPDVDGWFVRVQKSDWVPGVEISVRKRGGSVQRVRGLRVMDEVGDDVIVTWWKEKDEPQRARTAAEERAWQARQKRLAFEEGFADMIEAGDFD